MKLSEYKFKHVNLGGIRSSIELMDEFISEKYDFLVIEPFFVTVQNPLQSQLEGA